MSYYRAWFHLFWRFIGWVIHHSARRTCQNEPQPQECVYETRRERRWPLAVGIASALCFVFFFQRKIPVCCAHGITHALSHLSLSFSFFLSFPSCPSIGIRWTSHHRESPFFFSCSQNELRSCTSSPCLFLLFPCCCCCFFFKRRICVTICGNSCSRTSGSALTRRHRRCCEICQCAAVR